MKLNELFDKPIAPNGGETLSFGNTVTFAVDDIQYEVMFANNGGGNWEVAFDAELPSGERTDSVTGSGNEIAVFSTVNAIVRQFLSSAISKVKTLSFTSNVPSRTKLYKRIAGNWAKQFNLSLNVGRSFIDEDEFVLTNPNFGR